MITTDLQIRFSDLDILQHVNNSVLVQFYDLGKCEYFSQVMGLSQHVWNRNSFAIVSVKMDFMQEVRGTDEVYVTTRISKLGVKSVTFSQQIIDRATGDVKSQCESVLSGFDLEKRCSMEILPERREAIIAYEGDDLIIK
ncbi:MAG: thioesterase family protein [Rikenellaceae bacterium]